MTQFEGRNLTCLRGERYVFAGLDFSVGPGEALLLTGPNGSGKSSLLRLMAGLLQPADGRITWDGTSIRDDPEAHNARLHYLGHLDAVKPVLTVAENLAFWSGLRDGAEHVLEALDGTGIAHLADVPGRLLSAGQKRRLALARLLAAPAELWLLDEPTVGLDRESVARLNATIAAQRARGGRVVVTSHTPIDMPGCATLTLEDFAAAGVPELA